MGLYKVIKVRKKIKLSSIEYFLYIFLELFLLRTFHKHIKYLYEKNEIFVSDSVPVGVVESG